MGIRREEEMEMSDDDSDENPCKRMRTEERGVCDQTQASLKEENDSLRWQLDAYRNEVELLRKEQSRSSRQEDDHMLTVNHSEAQIQLLQQNMHSMQQIHTDRKSSHIRLTQTSSSKTPHYESSGAKDSGSSEQTGIRCFVENKQLLSLQEKLSSKEAELELAREEHRYLEGGVLTLRDQRISNGDAVEATNGDLQETVVNGCSPSLHLSRQRRNNVIMRGAVASEKEALLLGVISTFLHVHPFGANLEYLWSYIQRLDSKVSAGDLERLMVRLPSMFRQELSGVGATLEKRWKFCGFESFGSA